jgi:hypothetical protein
MTKLYPDLGDSRGLLGLMSRELMTRCTQRNWNGNHSISVEVTDLVPFGVFIGAAQSNLDQLEEAMGELGHRMNRFIELCMSLPV